MIGDNKIGRNQICPKCDSGKKYKHCCGHPSKHSHGITQAHIQQHYNRHQARELRRQQQQGRGRPIISAKVHDQQIVAVGNTIHASKTFKTFTDFLSHYIKTVFANQGKEWGTEELEKPYVERHPILQWYHDLCDLQRQTFDASKEIQRYGLTNSVTCYLGLAYNLYLLQHNVELQNIYIKRLKDVNNFQGTYYELIVAGSLIRAGFRLELEDETNPEFKHCEFSAVSLTTGKKYWVEAKARSVAGVLGKTDGARKKDPTSRLSVHVGKAFEKPAADDRFIFVDVNTPIEAGIFPDWIGKAEKKLEQMERDTSVDKKAYIFVTNMGFHWHPKEPKISHAVMAYGFHIEDFAKSGHFRFSELFKRKQKHIDAHEIMEAFKKYPAIPDTFDGELPSVAYHKEIAPPTIGESISFQGPDGLEIKTTMTSGLVDEYNKRMLIGTVDGQILSKEISDKLLEDYRKHPETFFGIIHDQGKNYDDDYEFYERLIQIHSHYTKQDIIRQIRHWPNLDEWSALSRDELVLVYCESLLSELIRRRTDTSKS